MIDLRGVEHTWKQFALRAITLHIGAGEYLGLVGHNGAGKTLLLETLAGLWIPARGTITIEGRDVTRTPPEQRHLGVVYQELFLFPHLSVRENICYGLKSRGVAPQRIRTRLEALDHLLRLGELMGRRNIAFLSGGEKQKVALARALAGDPSILLLDEPTHALDHDSREMVHEILRSLHQAKRLTMVHVSHDEAPLRALANRLVVMEQGRIVRIDEGRRHGPEERFTERP